MTTHVDRSMDTRIRYTTKPVLNAKRKDHVLLISEVKPEGVVSPEYRRKHGPHARIIGATWFGHEFLLNAVTWDQYQKLHLVISTFFEDDISYDEKYCPDILTYPPDNALRICCTLDM